MFSNNNDIIIIDNNENDKKKIRTRIIVINYLNFFSNTVSVSLFVFIRFSQDGHIFHILSNDDVVQYSNNNNRFTYFFLYLWAISETIEIIITNNNNDIYTRLEGQKKIMIMNIIYRYIDVDACIEIYRNDDDDDDDDHSIYIGGSISISIYPYHFLKKKNIKNEMSFMCVDLCVQISGHCCVCVCVYERIIIMKSKLPHWILSDSILNV